MLMDPQRETHPRQPGLIGEGVGFERTRRITGYLVGTLDRFNNAKRAEERDRVRHGVEGSRLSAEEKSVRQEMENLPSPGEALAVRCGV